MLRVFVLSVVFVSTSFLLADDKTDKVLKDLQGEWKVEKLVSGGKEVPAKKIEVMRWIIKDKSITFKDSKASDITGTFTINIEKKPAWIDVKAKPEKTALGIFELDGDTLKICGGEDKRPTEFTSTEKSDTDLFILKRVKK